MDGYFEAGNNRGNERRIEMKNYVAIVIAAALGVVAMLGFYARMKGIEEAR